MDKPSEPVDVFATDEPAADSKKQEDRVRTQVWVEHPTTAETILVGTYTNEFSLGAVTSALQKLDFDLMMKRDRTPPKPRG